jgi:hypothetical protein
MKKLGVLIGSFFFWIVLGASFVSGLAALVTRHAKSTAGTAFIVVACALAFWSFYGAYKKSRVAGAASFADLYEDLAFRFCLTPLLTSAAIMFVAVKLT